MASKTEFCSKEAACPQNEANDEQPSQGVDNTFKFGHQSTNQFLSWVYMQEGRLGASRNAIRHELTQVDSLKTYSWEQLTNELRMLSIPQILEHDHILQIQMIFGDLFASDLIPSLTYESSEIGNLASYLERKERDLVGYEPLQICRDVAEGLSVLHHHGVTHNDVQCDSVLLFIKPERNYRRLSAKLGGFGSISFHTGPRVPLGLRRWTAAPELVAGHDGIGSDETSHLGLQAVDTHDIYSLGLLCWAVHLRSANPFLHDLFALTELTPSQNAARHWASSNLASRNGSEGKDGTSWLSQPILSRIESIKADPSNRLLKVIHETFRSIGTTESSRDLKDAVSWLCLHDPKARSMAAAMAALGSPNTFGNRQIHLETKDGELSIWEEGWLLSLRPESRIESFNQQVAIQGTQSSLLDKSRLNESSLQRLYLALKQFRKQRTKAVYLQRRCFTWLCQFFKSVVEAAAQDKRPEVPIIVREAGLALFELHIDRFGSTTDPGIVQLALGALGQAVVLESDHNLYPIATSMYLRFHYSLQPKIPINQSLKGIVAESHALGGMALNMEPESISTYNKPRSKPPLLETQQRFLPLNHCKASLRHLIAETSLDGAETSREDLITGFLRLASHRREGRNPLLTATLDNQGTTVLHFAVRSGLGLPTVKFLINEIRSDIDVVDGLFNTPLHYAVCIGDRPMVKFLVDNGASPLKRNALGQLPVHLIYNMPPEDLEPVMRYLTKNNQDAVSLARNGFGTYSVEFTEGSQETTLLLQAIAFRRPDIVRLLLKMASDILISEDGIKALQQAFRYQVAYQDVSNAMSSRILRIVNPWKLLMLSLEATPDLRILWHGPDYTVELHKLFQFVASLFFEELAAHPPERLFYQALRTNNVDILPTIRGWQNILQVEGGHHRPSWDVLKPGIKSFGMSCRYGDMRAGKTMAKTWLWLDDTRRSEVLSNREMNEQLLTVAIHSSESSSKNKKKVIMWLLRRGFQPGFASFLSALKVRHRKCAALLVSKLDVDFQMASRVVDEALRVGDWLLRDFISVVNNSKRVREGTVLPIERLTIVDERGYVVSKRLCLLDHFSRSPSHDATTKYYHDVIKVLCDLFRDTMTKSPLSDVAPLEHALFSQGVHLLDVFLEFVSDDVLLEVANIWWLTPKIAKAVLELLELGIHIINQHSLPFLASEDFTPVRRVLPSLRYISSIAASGFFADPTIISKVIRKKARARLGRWREKEIPVKFWGTLLVKISLLDEQSIRKGDKDLRYFSASEPVKSLISELDPLRPVLHTLKSAFGLCGVITEPDAEFYLSPQSVFDWQEKKGHLFNLSRNAMLAATFGFLLSSSRTFTPPEGLLSVFGISRSLLDSARVRWHAVINWLSGMSQAEEGWRRSKMYMDKYLQLVSLAPTPGKHRKKPAGLSTTGPLSPSISLATKWLFTKDRQILRRVAGNMPSSTLQDSDINAIHMVFHQLWTLFTVLLKMDGDESLSTGLAAIQSSTMTAGLLNGLFSSNFQLSSLEHDSFHSPPLARYTLRHDVIFTFRLLGRVVCLAAAQSPADANSKDVFSNAMLSLMDELNLAIGKIDSSGIMNSGLEQMIVQVVSHFEEEGLITYKNMAKLLVLGSRLVPSTDGGVDKIIQLFSDLVNIVPGFGDSPSNIAALFDRGYDQVNNFSTPWLDWSSGLGFNATNSDFAGPATGQGQGMAEILSQFMNDFVSHASSLYQDMAEAPGLYQLALQEPKDGYPNQLSRHFHGPTRPIFQNWPVGVLADIYTIAKSQHERISFESSMGIKKTSKRLPPDCDLRLELLIRRGHWIESAQLVTDVLKEHKASCLVEYTPTSDQLNMMLFWCQTQAGRVSEALRSFDSVFSFPRTVPLHDWFRADCLLAFLERDIATSTSFPQSWDLLSSGHIYDFMTQILPAYFFNGFKGIVTTNPKSMNQNGGQRLPEELRPAWHTIRCLLDGGYDSWHFNHDHQIQNEPKNFKGKAKARLSLRFGFPRWGIFNILRYHLHFLDTRIKDATLSDSPTTILATMHETLHFILTSILHQCSKTTSSSPSTIESPCDIGCTDHEVTDWGIFVSTTVLHDVRLRYILVEAAIELAKLPSVAKENFVIDAVAAMLSADNPFLASSTRAAAVYRLEGARDLGKSNFAAAAASFSRARLALEEDVRATRIKGNHGVLRETRGLQAICEFLASKDHAQCLVYMSSTGSHNYRNESKEDNGRDSRTGVSIDEIFFCAARNHQLFLHLAERMFRQGHRIKATELLHAVLTSRPRLGRDQFPLLKRSLSESDLSCAMTRSRPVGSRGGRTTQDDVEILLAREVASQEGELTIGAKNTEPILRVRIVTGDEDSIQTMRKDFDAVSQDNPNRPNMSTVLGGSMLERYKRTGAIDDLEEAVRFTQEAVDTSQVDHPYRALFLNNLSITLGQRYLKLKDVNDLQRSIQATREGLEVIPEGSTDRGERLNHLGAQVGMRYSRIGSIADLEETIQLLEDAVKSTIVKQSEKFGLMKNLHLILRQRYDSIGALADLQESLRLARKVVEMTPRGHNDWVDRSHKLARVLLLRYERLKTKADLEESMQISREVIRETSDHGHPDRYEHMFELAKALEEKEGVASLDECIQLTREALEEAPQEFPFRSSILSLLGQYLRKRFQKTGTKADLQEAVRVVQESIEMIPEEDPDRGTHLLNFAHILIDVFLDTRVMADFEAITSCLRSVLDLPHASPRLHIVAGLSLMHMYASTINDWQRAYEFADTIMPLVPRLSLKSLETSDKQYKLSSSSINGLALAAAAIALHADQGPLAALNLLEQGRGVLSASFEEIRTDVQHLRDIHPALESQFIRLRDELELPAPSITPDASQSTVMTRRYNAAKALDDLVVEIRKQPGFGDFLLAPSEVEMRLAAKDGPIVVINVSSYRCDAILVEQHRIRSIALPELKEEDIKEKAQGGLGRLKVLEWLWDVIANPVLNALGFLQLPTDNAWPHIWWVPTGALTKFPLHAAGRHTKDSTDAVLDRVMSSYGSSIKAIIHGRRRGRVSKLATPSPALLISMQYTPGIPELLPFAAEEIQMLRTLCESMGLDPIEPSRRKKDVLAHLRNCEVFHFAGHGHTDNMDPSKSHLLLQDWATDRLTVGTLLDINLRERSPFLAYLSACGTGEIRDAKFFDESIHLISACQLAGFRHVIGTLWEVNDESCVDIAKITYEGIRDGGMSDKSVCQGLHKATRELRDRWLNSSTKARKRRRRSVTETDASSVEARIGVRSVSEENNRDGRLARKAVFFDSDDEDEDDRPVGPSHWVPYVHFGV